MRGSIVPGDGKHNPVDGDLVSAAAAVSQPQGFAHSQPMESGARVQEPPVCSMKLLQQPALHTSPCARASAQQLGSRFCVHLCCCRPCLSVSVPLAPAGYSWKACCVLAAHGCCTSPA